MTGLQAKQLLSKAWGGVVSWGRSLGRSLGRVNGLSVSVALILRRAFKKTFFEKITSMKSRETISQIFDLAVAGRADLTILDSLHLKTPL